MTNIDDQEGERWAEGKLKWKKKKKTKKGKKQIGCTDVDDSNNK